VTRRPGLLIGGVFAIGALLGIGASSMFLGIDAVDIRTSAEAQFPARSGPLAEMVLGTIDEQGIFERAAADVRARQVRNLWIAAAVTAVLATGLGMAFSRRTAAQPSSARSAATVRADGARSGRASPRPKTPASSSPGRGGSSP
jgi:hypothetical protein